MDIHHFFVAGINYKKSNASLRGQFAINSDQYASLLQNATDKGLQELFVLSTCNRTEIYGFASCVNELMNILCDETAGDVHTFKSLAYIRQGSKAVEHLYNVAAGLNSQILGDYEIVGQIKQAVKFARMHNFTGTFTERLVSNVLQASKAIRNNTQLSSGTVSVAFAAIQFLKKNVADAANKRVLLVGTGKIGCNTCKNLIDYIGNTNITLINRTDDKAKALACELCVSHKNYDALNDEIHNADIIIVSTNATEPVIRKEQLLHTGNKILIDLSIPNNIDEAVRELQHVFLINVDELSKLNDETLQNRLAEVPKAKQIIAAHIQEFKEWYINRKHVPVLVAVKEKLMAMHCCSLYTSATAAQDKALTPVDTTTVQKVINTMAVKLRCDNQPGCNYIQAINDYIGETTD